MDYFYVLFDLQVKSLNSSIDQKCLEWYGYVKRMTDCIPRKEVWNTRSVGKKSRGRPPKSWNGCINQILRKKQISGPQAKQVALNKKEWISFSSIKKE